MGKVPILRTVWLRITANLQDLLQIADHLKDGTSIFNKYIIKCRDASIFDWNNLKFTRAVAV